MIKTWEFEFNQVQGREIPDIDDYALVQDVFSGNLKRLARLEDYGFEGVFFSEHHFVDILSPCPNLLVAALSRMTRRLRLGVMGNVLAFHQPWRVAEEIAMLDYITEGRLEIGVSAGVAPEFTFLGIPPEDVRPIYAEVLSYLEKALVSPSVSHEGRFFSFDDVPLSPRIRPETAKRRWMTVFTEGSAVTAAKTGYKISTGYQSLERIAAVFQTYLAAVADAGGRPDPDLLGMRRQVLIRSSNSEAEALNAELIEVARNRMSGQFAKVNARLNRDSDHGLGEGVRQTGVMDASAPVHVDASGKPKEINAYTSGRVSDEDEFICGSPATVAERIIDQCRRTGCGNFLAYHAIGLSNEEVDEHYRLFAEITPILAKAELHKSVV